MEDDDDDGDERWCVSLLRRCRALLAVVVWSLSPDISPDDDEGCGSGAKYCMGSNASAEG